MLVGGWFIHSFPSYLTAQTTCTTTATHPPITAKLPVPLTNMSSSETAAAAAATDVEDARNQDHDLQALTKEAENTSLKLESITDGVNEHGVPKVKFVEDIDVFAKTFDPPASAELMIGAYSDLFGKFKTYEGSLVQKSE